MAPAGGERIEAIVQFDTFMGFVNSQRLGTKTTAYPDLVLLLLLKTRLGKEPSVQQMYASSVLEVEAADPLPEDLASKTGIIAKRRSAAF